MQRGKNDIFNAAFDLISWRLASYILTYAVFHFAAYLLLILVHLGHFPPPAAEPLSGRLDTPPYLVRANVFEVMQCVVEATLHDTEVLVQFVHDVGAVTVQLAGVRLLPGCTLDRQRCAQMIGLQLYRSNSQRPNQLANFFLQALHSANTRRYTCTSVNTISTDYTTSHGLDQKEAWGPMTPNKRRKQYLRTNTEYNSTEPVDNFVS